MSGVQRVQVDRFAPERQSDGTMARVSINVMETPWNAVAGKPVDWSLVPRPFAKIVAMPPGLAFPTEPNEALFTTDVIPNKGTVTGSLVAPPMDKMTGCDPRRPAGSTKVTRYIPALPVKDCELVTFAGSPPTVTAGIVAVSLAVVETPVEAGGFVGPKPTTEIATVSPGRAAVIGPSGEPSGLVN
jgi:hypothetical protein